MLKTLKTLFKHLDGTYADRTLQFHTFLEVTEK